MVIRYLFLGSIFLNDDIEVIDGFLTYTKIVQFGRNYPLRNK